MPFLNSIGFFQPLYLWALSFIAVILAIHFFRKRRLSHFDFSTLRFFTSVAVRTSRLRKLRRFLQFLVRALIVACLVMLFAGVYNRHNRLALLHNPAGAVYTWVDPSVSMEYSKEGVSVGKYANNIVDTLLAVLPSGVRHYHYDNTSAEFLHRRFFSGEEFTGGYGSSGPGDMLQEFRSQKPDDNAILIVLSDFTDKTMAEFEALEKYLKDITVIAVSVAPHDPWNYSLRTLFSQNSPNEVSFEVCAQGRGLDSVQATVTVDSMRVGEVLVSLQDGDCLQYSVELPPDIGKREGVIRLHTNDPLPMDDSDFFVLSQVQSRNVLIVGDKRENSVIGAAFSSLDKNRWWPVVKRSAHGVTAQDIRNADLIVINSLRERSGALDMLLSGSSFPEKSVILSLDPQITPSAAQAEIIRRLDKFTESISRADHENGVHPVIPDTLIEMWKGFPALVSVNSVVYSLYSGLGGDPLLKTDRAEPLISTFKDNDGRRWLVCATPLGLTKSNNFYQTGFYIPLLDRMAHYAFHGQFRPVTIWHAGISQRNPFFGRDAGADVFTNDRTMVARWETQPVVALNLPGIYSLVPDGDIQNRFAVHADPAEFRLDYRFAGNLQAENLFFYEAETFLDSIVQSENRVWSNGLWLLLSALVLVEVMLWGQGGKRKTQRAQKIDQ